LCLSIWLLLAAGWTKADTIVLKNGRRIVAQSVVEDGDKVRYQTSAGELSLPKSIVDHIEKGGPVPTSVGMPEGAANLAITPPAMESKGSSGAAGEIEHAAVHDGAIDRAYIGKLENEAKVGGQQAGMKAAIGHHAAAMFELAQGDMEHSLADDRQALSFAPEDPVVLMNVAYLHLRRSEYTKSLEYLELARRTAPDNPDVPKLAGWSYYGLNKMDQAVAEWKRSLALRPDTEVQAAMEKALRDKQAEENYKENESTHFNLKYSGASAPGLARDVLRTLEMHFSAIESELNFTPTDSIGVVLYTQQAFADITKAPGWVGALNDGRIRVPVQGLTSMSPELSRVLKHELTHSFIQQKTRGHAPTWIQEGLAQWMEGQRSAENVGALMQNHGKGQSPALGRLEGSWMGMPEDAVHDAYAWALANMEFLVEKDGMGDVERILDRIGRGESTDAALREVLHSDYSELEQDTAGYLQKTYGR
jgi:tetratricopeptide (TPR) repeat protein